MFFKESVLKRMMKAAYKGDGLILYRLDERTLYIAGGYWRIECKMEFIPKKIIGCIYELAGEIPEKGGFQSTKDGNQELLDFTSYNGINTNPFTEELKVSRTLQIGQGGTIQRLLQSLGTGMIYAVKQEHLAAVDPSTILREKGETIPKGPITDAKQGILYWNNVCKYMIWFRSDKENEILLNALKGERIVEAEE